MANDKAIMITGVGKYWGSKLAERLLQESGCHIIGINNKPPEEDIEGLDFIEAEIDNPLIQELLEREKVAVLCHLEFYEQGEQDNFDYDKHTLDTFNLLKSCGEAGVRHVIIRSSTSVYGAHPDNPAFLQENAPLRADGSPGTIRSLLDIERFCNDNRNKLKGLILYRFASIVGSTVDSPMTRFLKQERPIVMFGYDPVTQFIHEKDVVEALAQGAMNPVPGVFNIGADGAMPLTRVMRLIRKKPLPLFYRFAKKKFRKRRKTLLRKGRTQPIDWNYLRFPWVADLTRMRETLGQFPQYTAEEALRDFAGIGQGE